MGMISISDGLDRLEKMTEDELRSILRAVFYKVESLGRLMQIDVAVVGAFKRVMRYVLSLNILLVESESSPEEEKEMENTKAVLSKIKNANPSKMEEALYLTRDIAREFYVKTGLA